MPATHGIGTQWFYAAGLFFCHICGASVRKEAPGRRYEMKSMIKLPFLKSRNEKQKTHSTAAFYILSERRNAREFSCCFHDIESVLLRKGFDPIVAYAFTSHCQRDYPLQLAKKDCNWKGSFDLSGKWFRDIEVEFIRMNSMDNDFQSFLICYANRPDLKDLSTDIQKHLPYLSDDERAVFIWHILNSFPEELLDDIVDISETSFDASPFISNKNELRQFNKDYPDKYLALLAMEMRLKNPKPYVDTVRHPVKKALRDTADFFSIRHRLNMRYYKQHTGIPTQKNISEIKEFLSRYNRLPYALSELFAVHFVYSHPQKMIHEFIAETRRRHTDRDFVADYELRYIKTKCTAEEYRQFEDTYLTDADEKVKSNRLMSNIHQQIDELTPRECAAMAWYFLYECSEDIREAALRNETDRDSIIRLCSNKRAGKTITEEIKPSCVMLLYVDCFNKGKNDISVML
jgi:hypothetical protein